MSATLAASALHARWMIARDIPECVDLSYRRNDLAWLAEDFRDSLRDRCCIGYVVEKGIDVVGFYVIELYGKETQRKARVLKMATQNQAAADTLNAKLAEFSEKHNRKIVV